MKNPEESQKSGRVGYETLKYGTEEAQEGDLYLPGRKSAPVVCLLHGGFWRMPYGRDELGAVAADLASSGFAVWNLEYRRMGAPSGGWPGTFADVAAGIDFLADLRAAGAEIDLERVAVVGHSAGGHLALWSAARAKRRGELRRPARVQPFAAAGLAAIVDLEGAFLSGAGRGAVAELLQGSPPELPERYAQASPLSLLPLGVRQLIVHGSSDEVLPVEMARAYCRAALSAGDSVEYAEVSGGGHMDSLVPSSAAHRILCRWLDQCLSAGVSD